MANDDSAKRRWAWTQWLSVIVVTAAAGAVAVATLNGCTEDSPASVHPTLTLAPVLAPTPAPSNSPASTVPTEALSEATLTPTPIPVTPTAASLPTPIPFITPIPFVKAIPLPTFNIIPTLALAPTPAPAPTPMPRPTIGDLYQAMLGLINEARADQGLPLVVLGDNPAAQAHAEDMLENCYIDHWNLEGINGGARYSFAGGYQANRENISGNGYCLKSNLGVSLNEKVQWAMDGWLGSPGHRDTILDPAYRKVNIGLAWNAHQMYSAIQLEGDYIQYSILPTIGEDDIFTMEGSLYNGAGFYGTTDLKAVIDYHPPPAPLTVGQLARVYGSSAGLRAAQLRVPPAPGSHYTAHERVRVREYSRSPHDISPDLPAPRSSGESRDLWLEGKLAPKKEIEVTTYLVTASQWAVDTDTGAFRAVADISKMLDHYGPGVYNVAVWGLIDGKQDIVSQYSILWEGE